MSTIFKFARRVQVWLGDASEDEERAFQFLADTCSRLKSQRVLFDGTGMPDVKDDIWTLWSQVILRSWFTRLWVVQEALVSAGNVIITIGRQAQVSWLIFKDMVFRIGGTDWPAECPSYEQIDRRAQKAVEKEFYLERGIKPDEYVKNGYKNGCTPEDAVTYCLYRNLVNISDLTSLESYSDTDFGYLQRVLKLFGNRYCAYDQDRPNAMRGILPEKLRHGLGVYSIHADLPTVYREVSRLWLTNDPTLSSLQLIRPLPKFLPRGSQLMGTKLNNPSWVIDLGRVVIMGVGWHGVPNRTDGFHAGLVRGSFITGKAEWEVPKERSLKNLFKSITNIKLSNDSECRILGVVVGVVDALFSEFNAGTDQMTQNESPGSAFGTLFNESLGLVQCLTGDVEAAKEIHCRSIVLDRTDIEDPSVTTMIDIEYKHNLRRAYDKLSEVIRSQSLESENLHKRDSETSRFYMKVKSHQQSIPNWYSTTSGLVGRSLAVPVAGDVVAVFYGAVTTFLLRPVQGRQSTFEFMGESYTHRVMQGEALLEKNKKKYPKRKFILV